MTKHIAPIETLDPAEITLLLHAGELLLVDVREPEEYAYREGFPARFSILSRHSTLRHCPTMVRDGWCFTVEAVSARSQQRSGVSRPVSLTPLTCAAASQPGKPQACR